MHVWYEDRFGYAIETYSSGADAIATFPTTATAVEVRWIRGKLECCAPFGLDDLFGLVVRPNKRQITRDIYEAKVDRWRSIWPRLTYLSWEDINPLHYRIVQQLAPLAADRRGVRRDGAA